MMNPVISKTPLALINCWLEQAKIKDNMPPEDLHVVHEDEGVAEMGP